MYSFTIGEGSGNEYSARLGLIMFKCPHDEFTLVIEFFPSIDRVSVKIVFASLNIGQQSTKLFSKYSRSLFICINYHVTPPEYIYITMGYQGDKDSPAQGACHLITYGIEGNQLSNLDSDVSDICFGKWQNHLHGAC